MTDRSITPPGPATGLRAGVSASSMGGHASDGAGGRRVFRQPLCWHRRCRWPRFTRAPVGLLPVITVLIVLVHLSGTGWGRESIDLGGQWRFRLDPGDVGEAQRWFGDVLPGKIRLPGSLQEQGFGDDISIDTGWIGSIKDRAWFESPEFAKFRRPGNVKIPCWLQPEKHYVGAAWYQRDIGIPAGWKDWQIGLFLERCHWFTDVWVDTRHVGSGESLCVPHQFVLPGDLAAGKHTLTIRVDNRIRFKVGNDAHSVSDHTQTNWNGLIGDLRLTARPKVWIDAVRTFPGSSPDTVRIVATVGNATGGSTGTGHLQVAAAPAGGGGRATIAMREIPLEPGTVSCEMELSLGAHPGLWDEFHPNLYRFNLTLDAALDGKDVRDQIELVSGIRTVGTKGTQLTVNDRPVFLRGTLECCIFPKTGYPPADTAAWKRIMGICRAHGLNHLRFHSWCPPEAAFRAADELGFYLQVELPTWTHNLGKDPPRDAFLRRELDRILDVHGNHPSFILMTMGNELSGGKEEFLAGLVEHAIHTDPRRLYASSTHEYRSETDQFRVTMRIVGNRIRIRGMRGPGTDWDFANAIADEKIPVISHEIGQFCVWPDFDEIGQYTGLLKARNFELFRQRLADQGMLGQARDFLMSSGKLQALCYKEEIESMLRTPGFGGFQLLDLHDFPGQGTALVGVLNAFWNQKGYITPEAYRRFCNETVPLARFTKRVWTSSETFEARIDLAHFGESDLAKCTAEWTLTDDLGKTVDKGRLAAVDVPTGGVTTLGGIKVKLDRVRAPAALKLTVSIPGAKAANDWNLWVYPETAVKQAGAKVLVRSDFDETTAAALADGGRVVLLPPLKEVKGRPEKWLPVFWNTQWIRSSNRSLGLLCDIDHPALAGFPTAFHSDWQWYDLMNRSVAVDLGDAPAALRPIVQVVPDWNHPRREALIFECKVGRGRLLVCSADLSTDLDKRPAARQLRGSLMAYAAGRSFDPAITMTPGEVRSLVLVSPADGPGKNYGSGIPSRPKRSKQNK